jgi:hypothetical protein
MCFPVGEYDRFTPCYCSIGRRCNSFEDLWPSLKLSIASSKECYSPLRVCNTRLLQRVSKNESRMRPSFNLRPSSSMLSIFFKYAVNYPKTSILPYIILRKLILCISSPKKNNPTFYRRLSVSREVLGRGVSGLFFFGGSE